MNRKIFTGLMWLLISSPILLVIAMLLLLVAPAKAAAPGVNITLHCRDMGHAEVTVSINNSVNHVVLYSPLHYAPIWAIWDFDGARDNSVRVDIPYNPPDNPTNDPDIQYIIDHWLEIPMYFYVNTMVNNVGYDYQVNVPVGIANCNGSSAQAQSSSSGSSVMAAPQIPMNECIPQPFPIEGSGVFVVDNNSYSYNQNLSFTVPASAVWVWDVYINDVKILTLEQTADVPCHISADYR